MSENFSAHSSDPGSRRSDTENNSFSLSPQDQIPLPGSTLLDNRYVIERALGRGGFGITYMARQQTLNQPLVIKEYLPRRLAVRSTDLTTVMPTTQQAHMDFQSGLSKFVEEAQNIAKFDNPHIVKIQDYFRANGTAYFVMPYIPGKTLSELLVQRQGHLPEEDLLRLFRCVLDGLEVLHAQKVLHLDIKPANIYIPDKKDPFLLDFGAARQALQPTNKSSIFLTSGYAPYEQYFASAQLGPHSDIYACGATLYACLKGEINRLGKLVPPPAARDRKESGAELPPLAQGARNRVSPEVERAIVRAMSLEPEHRQQTVSELLSGLRKVSAPAGNFRMDCIAGEMEGRGFPVTPQPMAVGKDPKLCPMVCQHPHISRRHCEFVLSGGAIHLRDLGSKNGTYVNERKLKPNVLLPLAQGDLVSLAGALVFRATSGQLGAQGQQGVQGACLSPPVQGREALFLKGLFTAKGRLDRGKFLGFLMLNCCATLLAFALLLTVLRAAGLQGSIAYMVFGVIWAVSLLSWNMVGAAKRLHDLGRSGEQCMLALIPLYGQTVFLGQLLFTPGTTADNSYGEGTLNKTFFRAIVDPVIATN